MTQTVKGTPPHPAERLPDERRAALFHVATEEFAAKGFTAASLNRIISEVGMSKSSFYHYFENKTDLFVQVLKAALGPMLEELQKFDVDSLDAVRFWPVFEAHAAALASLANETPDTNLIGRIFYRSLDNQAERALVADIMEESNRFLIAVLQRGQAIGCIRRDLPMSLMTDIWISLSMAADRWMLAHWDEFDDEERVALGLKFFDLFRRMSEVR